MSVFAQAAVHPLKTIGKGQPNESG